MKELLFFHAPWCGTWKVVELNLKKLEDIKITSISADKEDSVFNKYSVSSVSSIPTLIVLKDDKEIARNTGYLTLNDIKKLINGDSE